MPLRPIQLPESAEVAGNGTETEAIFRSAPMALVQFYVTIELARDVVWCLGDLGNVHFRDLNSRLTQFQRTFMRELRDVDATESHLKQIHASMVKYGTLKGDLGAGAGPGALPSSSEMELIKAKVAEFHDKIQHLNKSYDDLDMQKLQLLENRYVVNALTSFHRSALTSRSGLGAATLTDNYNFEIGDSDDEDAVALLHRGLSLEQGLPELAVDLGDEHTQPLDLLLEHANLESGFNTLAGTIERDKVPLLRKILWRTLRGNLYFQDLQIDEQFPKFTSRTSAVSEVELVDKNIFIIYIHGEYLRERVKRIILSLDGFIYSNVQGHQSSRDATLGELNYKIEDLANVVHSTKDHLIAELMTFQLSYVEYFDAVQKDKRIYQTLNKFDEDSTRRCLVGEGWIPETDLDLLKSRLRSLVELRTTAGDVPTASHDTDPDEDSPLIAVVNRLATNRTAPTFHKTNKFTAAFQLIIDAYGIATYQEVNPGLATVITFPFMFAIMFGDMGHGFIVFMILIYLIWNERPFTAMRNKDEIFEMAFTGRYIILLMGLFSMYTGFIYNDIFSKSMSLFSSGWEYEWPEGYDFAKDGAISLTAKKIAGKTYAFGLDWAWHGTENNLLFTNSYKMKLSILMGFIHMNYSLFFSLVNYRFFDSRVDIIGNFIPGFLFMQSIFGYLTLTILYKWSVDWLGTGKQPPGLLNMLINMFLAPTKIEDKLYPGQQIVQVVLVLVALVCVPWLLAYKPYVLYRQNKEAKLMGYSDLHSQLNHDLQLHEEEQAINGEPEYADEFLDDDEFRFPNDIEPLHHNSMSDHGTFNFGDVMIHQVIHTIEFCLNCVSHTASYLRLWALSLAHAQLSTVLWSMTIQNAFGATGAKGTIMTVALFGLWFTLTVCILVLMEGTSAMLHSLRLHWVEAMSKFFEGEGYAYEPFTFNDLGGI